MTSHFEGVSFIRNAASYSSLRGAPVISAASFTAVFTGNSCQQQPQHAFGLVAVGARGAAVQHQGELAARALRRSACNQAGSAAQATVATSSNCLVSSRPTVTGRAPSAASASASASMRCGASSSTTGADLLRQRLRPPLSRSPALAGRKPAKTKPPSSPRRPPR